MENEDRAVHRASVSLLCPDSFISGGAVCSRPGMLIFGVLSPKSSHE